MPVKRTKDCGVMVNSKLRAWLAGGVLDCAGVCNHNQENSGV